MGYCPRMTSTKSTSKAAAALGSVRSAAKTEAARKNGQLGGRPRALYRVYAIREAVFGGAKTKVLGEQIGGDIWGRAAAEEVAAKSGIPCEITQVGGVE